MRKVALHWRNLYSYIIPVVFLVLYLLYIKYGVFGKMSLMWVGYSDNFSEMCKAIIDFSSIILGVYGFFIPVVLGKKDKFTDYFWENIDTDRFANDMRRIFVSGIATIVLSIVLLLSDMFAEELVMILVGVLIVVITFYLSSTYRFIGIFISIIEGGKKTQREEEPQIKEPMTQEEKTALDMKIKEL